MMIYHMIIQQVIHLRKNQKVQISKGIDTSWEVFEKEFSYCAHIDSKTKFKNNKVGYLYLFDKKDFTNTREKSIQFFLQSSS